MIKPEILNTDNFSKWGICFGLFSCALYLYYMMYILTGCSVILSAHWLLMCCPRVSRLQRPIQLSFSPGGGPGYSQLRPSLAAKTLSAGVTVSSPDPAREMRNGGKVGSAAVNTSQRLSGDIKECRMGSRNNLLYQLN